MKYITTKLPNKRIFISLSAIILLSLLIKLDNLTPNVTAQTLNRTIYLPLVFNRCDATTQAAELAQLMKDDIEQQRASLNCNLILASVAQARAKDMATREYFSHVNPEGYGPNYLVRQAGYVLPDYYGTGSDANNIESIAAGYDTATSVWANWMTSAPHRNHLLGLDTFYAEQIDYGIGYYYDANSPYQHYWVVITAKSGLD